MVIHVILLTSVVYNEISCFQICLQDYDWPMEGYIMLNAPVLHKGDKKQGMSGSEYKL